MSTQKISPKYLGCNETFIYGLSIPQLANRVTNGVLVLFCLSKRKRHRGCLKLGGLERGKALLSHPTLVEKEEKLTFLSRFSLMMTCFRSLSFLDGAFFMGSCNLGFSLGARALMPSPAQLP